MWCSQVFPDTLDLLCIMFTQSLEALDSPLSRSLQAAMQNNTKSLATLTDTRQVGTSQEVACGNEICVHFVASPEIC